MSVSEVVKESDSTQVHSEERRLVSWAKHYGGQSSFTTTPVEFPLMNASEPMQMGTGPSSEGEVMSELSFLKIYKTVKPDGPSLSFFKDSREMLTLKLKTPRSSLSKG